MLMYCLSMKYSVTVLSVIIDSRYTLENILISSILYQLYTLYKRKWIKCIEQI